MRLSVLFLLMICSINLYGQNNNVTLPDSILISKEQLSQTFEMLKELNTMGVEMSGDSVIVSDEFNRLLKDQDYFNSVYPKTYTWEETIHYIQTKELKKAFWYLINLYPKSEKNKQLVITSVLSYEKLFQMDKVLINTFYTYAFTDPEVSTIINDFPEIKRPDILENKLQVVNELVHYINSYRQGKEI